jgi:hypothetical protein
MVYFDNRCAECHGCLAFLLFCTSRAYGLVLFSHLSVAVLWPGAGWYGGAVSVALVVSCYRNTVVQCPVLRPGQSRLLDSLCCRLKSSCANSVHTPSVAAAIAAAIQTACPRCKTWCVRTASALASAALCMQASRVSQQAVLHIDVCVAVHTLRSTVLLGLPGSLQLTASSSTRLVCTSADLVRTSAQLWPAGSALSNWRLHAAVARLLGSYAQLGFVPCHGCSLARQTVNQPPTC